jgi:hypothetical protein
MSERFDDETSNPGWDNKWTCPGCYADLLNADHGVKTCPCCHRKLILEVRQQPVCVATICEGEEP